MQSAKASTEGLAYRP